MNIFLWVFIFILCFYLLLKTSEIFLDKAILIGEYFNLSKALIGLTIVAIGSSAPELITSLSSFFFTENYPKFIIGTTIGSNITNIILAFALFLFFAKKIKIDKISNFKILSLFFLTIFISIFIFLNEINYFILFAFFFYIFFIFYSYKKDENKNCEKINHKKKKISKTYFLFFLSIIFMIISSYGIVKSTEEISNFFNISLFFLTYVIIAIATSLPEILVSYNSAKKKEYTIATTNILGTNIMNLCFIIGTSGFFGSYIINLQFIHTTIFFLISTIIFLYLIYKKEMNRYHSYLFFLIYFFYIILFFI